MTGDAPWVGRLTPAEFDAAGAAAPEARRLAWVGKRPGRSIEAEGDWWIARQDGDEVDRAPRLLAALMDRLEPR